MITTWVNRALPWAVLLGFGATAIFAMVTMPRSFAQATPICHVAMVLDRSGSVGPTNEQTLQAQIAYLFQPPGSNGPGNGTSGIYDSNIYLAFWSFASATQPYSNPNYPPLANPNSGNYDWPYYGFVSSHGEDPNFMASLHAVASLQGAATDYEQGFGYNGGVLNPYMASTIKQADIIVFMTDGLPNTPPIGGGDGNSTATTVARSAVLKLKAGGAATGNPKMIIGGIIGNASPGSLNLVINGSTNDSSGLFHITSNYSDLATKLTSIIGNACDQITPPPPPKSDYKLEPSASTTSQPISGTDSATFTYNIHNTSSTDASNPTDWSIKQIVVAPNQPQSVTNLLSINQGGKPYHDSYSCNDINGLVAVIVSPCVEIKNGRNVFNHGDNPMAAFVGDASTVKLDDGWSVGTRVCRVLTLAKPTAYDTPTNRFSRAACSVVGKRPTLHIYGGDVIVGRPFVGPTGSVTGSSAASIHTSTTQKSDGKTYGSWAEYAVMAPGQVDGFASNSKLKGGFAGTQNTWSDLTFANTDNQYGYFTQDNNGQGDIPDVASVLLTRSVTQNLAAGSTFLRVGTDMQSGLYKSTGDLNIGDGSGDIIIGKDRTIIVSTSGTVTIKSNIGYYPGPYSDISEIPQLVIIANTINIDPGVTNVDAWLIANGSSDGTISTCDDQSSLSSKICNKPLTINGPIMARHLNLRRTAGSGPGADSSTSAETIYLPGSTYLWSQSEGHSAVRAQTTFTTELPPYF